MLILFGVLVDYEDTAAPVDSTVHGSDGEIATFYPCTLMIVLQWLARIVLRVVIVLLLRAADWPISDAC